MNIRKFKLSCKFFSGFTCFIDLDEHDSMESVIEEVKTTLKRVLKSNNLEVLLRHLDHTTYHYHNYTFADTLIYNRTFYICNHCDLINLVI
jgi:hypothetical protein